MHKSTIRDGYTHQACKLYIHVDARMRTATSHSLLKQLIEAIAFGVRHIGIVQMTRALDHSVLNGLHCLGVSGFIGHLQPIDKNGLVDGRRD